MACFADQPTGYRAAGAHLPAGLLDLLALSAACADAAGRVRYANAAALALFEERSCLRLDGDRLVAIVAREDALLRSALASAAQGPDGIVFLRFEGDARASPVTACVASLPDGADGTILRALIFSRDAASGGAVGRWLMATYGLSQAETRVAVAVGRGQPPGTLARELGVKISTVRSQLRQVFLKLRIRRQSALVRLVCSHPAGWLRDG